MRKYHQRMILELLRTLEEATDNLKKLFSKKESQAVTNLLADCQDTAIQIGQFIEQLEGEQGTQRTPGTVTLLEEYCELLYHANVELSKPESGAGPIKKLQKQIVKIEESVKSDLKPDKIEVVFFPYKASMWDSLESIWLAAKDDPACDAYVVPIPYYTRKPDGSFDKLMYEGAEFPEYVPITHYSEYNLSERRPDVVYIHNPYDNNNYVTSVHPDYYSWELKKHTDLLVYVVYGLWIPPKTPQPKLAKPTKPIIPEQADIAIVQRGETKRLTDVGLPRVYNVALGSPKIDKIINTQRENCVLPDEWKNLIGNKKVILYNVHLTGVWDRKRDIISRLRYVFSLFQKRGDVILWWRPHPLIEDTIKSMNPGMLNEYRRVVEEYRAAGFGIYDDTSDLHRAIACTDAYYGDEESSVLWMYGFTGKPIMIQNAGGISENKQFSNLLFQDIYDDGKNFWFTAQNFNALFKMDKQTWIAEYVGSFPNEISVGVLYGQIAEHDGKLYFAPRLANELAVFDIVTQKFEKISLIKQGIGNSNDYGSNPKFWMTVAYKGCIFFIGLAYPAIIRLDTKTGLLDYFTDWVEPLRKISSGDGYHFIYGHISENKIILPVASANAVVIFDMDKCVSEICEVGSKERKYRNACFDGENYWLSPRFNGPVVKWNLNTKEYKEYNNYPAGFEPGQVAFCSINYWNNCLWLFPQTANMALKIDVKDGNMAIAEEFMSECEYKGEEIFGFNYLLSMVAEDTVYLHTGKTNRFIEYNRQTKQQREKEIALTEEAVQGLNENCSTLFSKDVRICTAYKQCCFYENSLFRLSSFLNCVVQETEGLKNLHVKQIETVSKIANNTDGTCGEKVYEYVKNAAQSTNR